MRKIWFLGCLNVLGVAFGQPPTSCIQDIITSAVGATPIQLGTIQISWPAFNYNAYTINAGQKTYTVNNGLVGGTANPLCLVPTDHSSKNVAYTVQIGAGLSTVPLYWKIATNGGPFSLATVTVPRVNSGYNTPVAGNTIPPTSLVSDTLYDGVGVASQLATLVISWPAFVYCGATAASTVPQGSYTYTVNNGLVSLALVPTDLATSTVTYSVVYVSVSGAQSKVYWQVPTNGGPFTIANIITSKYVPPVSAIAPVCVP